MLTAITGNPQLDLRTTYKMRCHRGLNHPNPASPDACHKAARGDLSKYCSDACGVAFMNTKIATWARKGGDKAQLWESVKHAERREGVTVCAERAARMDVDAAADSKCAGTHRAQMQAKSRVQLDMERLDAQLDGVVQQREQVKKEMEVVLWRARLLDLASERAERVEECAWDQRLCFGEEECAEYGADVLASYEEKDPEAAGHAMQVDACAPAEEGEWWCRGKTKCARHAGCVILLINTAVCKPVLTLADLYCRWQKLRAAEVSLEKEMKESILFKLTTREREIRTRIEDLLEPQARAASAPSPLKPANGRPPLNGHAKAVPNGDVARKGKKKRG